MTDPRLDKLARVLVQYCAGVRRGDVVSLVAAPLAEPLIVSLYRHVLGSGGLPSVRMVPEACQELLYRYGSPEQLGFPDPNEVRETETVDVSIRVLAMQNTRALTNVDPARQTLQKKARRPMMERFLRRAADKSLRWVVTQYPCAASAQEAEMSLTEYEEFVFAAGMLDHDDPVAAWRALSERQARLRDHLQPVHELHFHTPRGTDLYVGVRGRTWINCDGKENFPDGEVFTGPVEDATRGTICFDFPAVYGGREVRGVRLTFRDGRVIDASAEKSEVFLIQMLDQDPGARVLGEVAIGCNYAITRHTRNTLFDEKIGGTFHVALGAAYPESGGKNQSALHWDMVCDLRSGGRIVADGRLISEDGRFVDLRWPQNPLN
jgi:aminopeptidase